jgi:hypothetical protein
VHSCSHRLRPRNPPSYPSHLGSYTWTLLVSQDRQHLFVTPFLYHTCTREQLWLIQLPYLDKWTSTREMIQQIKILFRKLKISRIWLWKTCTKKTADIKKLQKITKSTPVFLCWSQHQDTHEGSHLKDLEEKTSLYQLPLQLPVINIFNPRTCTCGRLRCFNFFTLFFLIFIIPGSSTNSLLQYT